MLNWADPAGPSPWSADEYLAWAAAAQALLAALRRHLGPDFDLVDESHTAALGPEEVARIRAESEGSNLR